MLKNEHNNNYIIKINCDVCSTRVMLCAVLEHVISAVLELCHVCSTGACDVYSTRVM